MDTRQSTGGLAVIAVLLAGMSLVVRSSPPIATGGDVPTNVLNTDGGPVVVENQTPRDIPIGDLLGVPANGILYFIEDLNPSGLYVLNMSNGSAVNIGASGVTLDNCGLTNSGDPSLLYGSRPYGLNHINADGSGAVFIGRATAEGMARDPNTGTVYESHDPFFFRTIDTATGKETASLAPAPFDCEGIAWGNGGVYGIGGSDANLYRYDPGSNTWSVIGNTGIPWKAAGLAFNAVEDMLYAKWGVVSAQPLLYRIDPVNGNTEVVGDSLIDKGGGLAWVGPAPCPWDTDSDGTVGINDFLDLLANWGPCP